MRACVQGRSRIKLFLKENLGLLKWGVVVASFTFVEFLVASIEIRLLALALEIALLWELRFLVIFENECEPGTFLCACACVRACMRACVRPCVHRRMRSCTDMFSRVDVPIHHIHMYVRTFIRTYVRACVCACVRAYVHDIHRCIHIYPCLIVGTGIFASEQKVLR